ncbi:hypothetical protein T492DRAFT_862782 [Pavlovales sp. CCMP2436]|nr:hypothetical protein T492DRAFT_862782 [Pavlovales sp. CCMP2436]
MSIRPHALALLALLAFPGLEAQWGCTIDESASSSGGCTPVDCRTKYGGARNVFDSASRVCVATVACATGQVYVPASNSCSTSQAGTIAPNYTSPLPPAVNGGDGGGFGSAPSGELSCGTHGAAGNSTCECDTGWYTRNQQDAFAIKYCDTTSVDEQGSGAVNSSNTNSTNAGGASSSTASGSPSALIGIMCGGAVVCCCIVGLLVRRRNRARRGKQEQEQKGRQQQTPSTTSTDEYYPSPASTFMATGGGITHLELQAIIASAQAGQLTGPWGLPTAAPPWQLSAPAARQFASTWAPAGGVPLRVDDALRWQSQSLGLPMPSHVPPTSYTTADGLERLELQLREAAIVAVLARPRGPMLAEQYKLSAEDEARRRELTAQSRQQTLRQVALAQGMLSQVRSYEEHAHRSAPVASAYEPSSYSRQWAPSRQEVHPSQSPQPSNPSFKSMIMTAPSEAHRAQFVAKLAATAAGSVSTHRQ